MNLYIPDNLDLEKLLEENPPHFKHHRDDLAYCIHLLIKLPERNEDNVTETGFVRIYSPLAQQYVRNYNKYYQYLEGQGIVESDKSYSSGSYSMSYRLTDKYGKGVKAVQISKFKLIAKILEYKKKKERSSGTLKKMRKLFNSKLKVDYEAALKYINDEFLSRIEEEGIEKATLKLRTWHYSVLMLQNQEFYFNVDDTSGRLHTNLSNMKRELRNFITYEGKQLVSIDIKNCQPLLTSILFNPLFYREEKAESEIFMLKDIGKVKKMVKKAEKALEEVRRMVIGNKQEREGYNSMLVENHEAAYYQEFERYQKICEQGRIYEYLQTHLKLKKRKRPITRDLVKTLVLKILYSSDYYLKLGQDEKKEAFIQLFPTVYYVFTKFKEHEKRLLAVLMQAIEAKLILEVIAPRLLRELPDVPFFTIHDSIVCIKGYEEAVANIIKEEVRKRIGVNTSIKIEEWHPSKVISEDSDISQAA